MNVKDGKENPWWERARGRQGANLHCALPFRHHNLAEVNAKCELTSVHPHARGVFLRGCGTPTAVLTMKKKWVNHGGSGLPGPRMTPGQRSLMLFSLDQPTATPVPAGSQQLPPGKHSHPLPEEQLDYCHQKAVQKAQLVVSDDLRITNKQQKKKG